MHAIIQSSSHHSIHHSLLLFHITDIHAIIQSSSSSSSSAIPYHGYACNNSIIIFNVCQSLPSFVGSALAAVSWCGVYLNLEIGSGCVADVGWRSDIQPSSSSSSSAIPYHGYACNNSIIFIIIIFCYSISRICTQ